MHEESNLANLAQAAMRGDAVAWGSLVECVRPRLFAFALWRLDGDAQTADDAVQDSLLLAQQGIAGLREPKAILGWLRTMVQRRCQRVRSIASIPAGSELSVEVDPSLGLSHGERMESLEGAMLQLPASDRNILHLAYFDDLPPAAIATLLGISPGATRKRLFDARVRLRALLDPD